MSELPERMIFKLPTGNVAVAQPFTNGRDLSFSVGWQKAPTDEERSLFDEALRSIVGEDFTHESYTAASHEEAVASAQAFLKPVN